MKSYEGLFTVEEVATDEDGEEEIDESFNRWGWLATIYELCEGSIWRKDDVENMGIIEVLNWLSYHKEKSDIINAKNKQRR